MGGGDVKKNQRFFYVRFFWLLDTGRLRRLFTIYDLRFTIYDLRYERMRALRGKFFYHLTPA